MVTATDATMRSLELFSDPDHWGRIDEDVPIFIEHQTHDQNGKRIKVDAKRLQKIADNINRNYEDNGCPIKFFMGHTRDPKTVSQDKQPEILAYGVGARVGRWGPKGKIGLLVKRIYCKKDKVEQYESLPERSAEFYPDGDELRGVALLRTDPRLDMGVMVYSGGDGVLRYQRGVHYMADDPTKLPPDKDAPPPKPGPGMGEDEEIPEEEKQKFMKYMAACYPHLANMKPDMPVGDDAGMPPPSAPGKEPPIAAGKDATSLHYARLEREHKSRLAEMESNVKKHTDALDRQRRVLVYERDLADLSRKGYRFDLAEELEECKDMPQAMFDKHKTKIVKHYTRDVASFPVVPVDWDRTNPGGDPNVISEDHQVAALKYQREHSVDWDEAIEKTRGGMAGARK